LPQVSSSGLSIVNQEENSGNRLCLLSVLLWLLYNRAIEKHHIFSCSNVSLTGFVGCALVLYDIGFGLLLQHVTNVNTNYSFSAKKKKGLYILRLMELARFL
jgi:hypothetical protein